MRGAAHLASKMLDELGRLGQQSLKPGYEGEDVTSRAMHLTRRVAGDCQVESRANASIPIPVSQGFGSDGEVVGVCFELAQGSHGSRRNSRVFLV